MLSKRKKKHTRWEKVIKFIHKRMRHVIIIYLLKRGIQKAEAIKVGNCFSINNANWERQVTTSLKYGPFFYSFDRLKTKMTAIKNKEHLTTIIRISQSPSSEKKRRVFEKIKFRQLQGEAPSVLILQIRSRDSISSRGMKLCSRDHKHPCFWI